jgi:hypothetical protein
LQIPRFTAANFSGQGWADHPYQAGSLDTDADHSRCGEASNIDAYVEGPVVKYIVELRYTGVDWADLMADMRSWLDRRQIKAKEFSHIWLGRGVVVRVGFYNEDLQPTFATSFSGRLQSAEPHRDDEPPG